MCTIPIVHKKYILYRNWNIQNDTMCLTGKRFSITLGIFEFLVKGIGSGGAENFLLMNFKFIYFRLPKLYYLNVGC